MKTNNEIIEYLQEEAYRRYQLDWLIQQGYSIEDVFNAAAEDVEDPINGSDLYEAFEEQGLKGSLYVCFDEFCGAEFADAKYMYHLLSGEDADLYQLIRILGWIDSQDKFLDENGIYAREYGIAVPHELLKPSQFCWTWPKGTAKADIVKDLQKRIEKLTAERMVA